MKKFPHTMNEEEIKNKYLKLLLLDFDLDCVIMILMFMGKRSLHLLHVFVVLLLCMKPASAFNSSTVEDGNIGCIEKEREALLKFKQGLVDDYGHLSSWGSEDGKRDCCKWKGIKCSNGTGHVIMLDLILMSLRGKINPSLLELEYLNYLDLSYNDFGGSHIPMFIGTLTKLRYLGLSGANFVGTIPYQLGNLTNLQYLDLGRNGDFINAENLEWLSHLSSLRHLDMTDVNLSKAIDWLQAINMLTSLVELQLHGCQLSHVVPQSLSFVNSSTSLALVDLPYNYISSSIFHWLFNFSASLVDVDLSYNPLKGSIPDAFHNMKSLTSLSLSSNQLEGRIPKSFQNICTLQSLDLSSNNFTEELSNVVQNLFGCTEDSLEMLDLSSNQFSGSLPDMTRFSSLRGLYLQQNRLTGVFNKKFGQLPALVFLYLQENRITGSLPDLTNMSSLRRLYIGKNQLNGTLPETIGQLSKLEVLDVSYNSLEGIVSDAHLLNLSRLKHLGLSFNSLSLDLGSHWIPPFQLDVIRLSSCKLGPHFPKWLQTQKNFSRIDISNNRISDSIPMWFWELSPRLIFLNLSCNQINGRLPNLSLKFSRSPGIDLSSNRFDGPLPLLPSNLTSLDLSQNMFFGSISSLCLITGGALTYIDLSNNIFSGELPDCWMHFQELVILNLANNNLSGEIPSSMGSLHEIRTLHLRKNSFLGELPSSLKNCVRLKMLDLGENKLFGKIPAWIGESLTELIVLSLRSNEFYGNMPWHLCHLTYVQILDLSQNNISGTIPQCLNNFTAMSQKGSLSDISHLYDIHGGDGRSVSTSQYLDNAWVVLKRLELEYGRNLGLVKAIDLSTNRLAGEIPGTIASLIELFALNLSRNNLTGLITPKIGQLRSLESLDLSQNRLFGEIPASLSTLNFLSVLDLSNNNLSSKIPTGTQLQSFDASSYRGNLDLCGPPLLNKCPGDETDQDPPVTSGNEESKIHENEDGFITPGFYISLGLGFTLGFWGVCGTLLLNSSWRYAYFHFLNDMRDMLYVIIAVNMARLQRRLQG